MSEEALQIAEKRREAKDKGGKKNLNAEFQGITRRDKEAFLNEQCKKKKKEENKRMGNTRDLFKEIKDTEGTFHANMGIIRPKTVWT